jgi:hypothetical protein
MTRISGYVVEHYEVFLCREFSRLVSILVREKSVFEPVAPLSW